MPDQVRFEVARQLLLGTRMGVTAVATTRPASASTADRLPSYNVFHFQRAPEPAVRARRP